MIKKLSEYQLEEGRLIICKILTPISNIANDSKMTNKISNFYTIKQVEEVVDGQRAIINKRMPKDDTSVIGVISSILPFILDIHSEDMYAILSALKNTDIENIKQQNLLETISELKELFKDKDLMALFQSASK